MHVLAPPSAPISDRKVVTWAASLLTAIARDEAAGRKPRRLTEPGLATWERFRGRLGPADLVKLLFEDAAVLHPVPFDSQRVGLGSAPLAPVDAQELLRGLAAVDLASPGAEYITAQARALGLPTRLARSELHVVRPHQRVLELPGTGGQLGHHLVTTQPGLNFRDNVAVACASGPEATLAGLAALDVGAPDTSHVVMAGPADLKDPAHPLRTRTWDFVVGLHPDKGGLFQIPEKLAIWFPGATFLLV